MEVLFLLAMVVLVWVGLGRGGGGRGGGGRGAAVTQEAEVGRVHVPGVGYLTVEELQKLCSGRGKLSDAKLWKPPGAQRKCRSGDDSMSDIELVDEMQFDPMYAHMPTNIYYDPTIDDFDGGVSDDDYSSSIGDEDEL